MAEAGKKNPLAKQWNTSFQPYVPNEKPMITPGWEDKKNRFYDKVDAQLERKLGYSVEHGIGGDDLVTPMDDDVVFKTKEFEVAPSIKGKLFTLDFDASTGKFEKNVVTRIDDDFLDALRRNHVFAYPAGETAPVQLSLTDGMDIKASYPVNTKVPENEPTFLERFLAFITFGLVYGDKVADYDKAVAATAAVKALKQKGRNAGVLLGAEEPGLDDDDDAPEIHGDYDENEPEEEMDIWGEEKNVEALKEVADNLIEVIDEGIKERQQEPVERELDELEEREREKFEKSEKEYGAEMDAVWTAADKVDKTYGVDGDKNAQLFLGGRSLRKNDVAEIAVLTSMIPDVQKLALKKNVVAEGQLKDFDALDPQEKDAGYTGFAKETALTAIEKYRQGSTKYLDKFVKEGLDQGIAKLEGMDMDPFGKDAGKAFKLANSMNRIIEIADGRTKIKVGEERRVTAEGYAKFVNVAVSAKDAMRRLSRVQLGKEEADAETQRKMLHTVVKGSIIEQFMGSGEVKPEDRKAYMLGLPTSKEISEMVDGIIDDKLEPKLGKDGKVKQEAEMSVKDMVALFSDKKNLDQFVRENVLESPANKKTIETAKEAGKTALQFARNKEAGAAEMGK